MTTRGYTLGVDWSNGGTFLNPYEDVTANGRLQDGEIEAVWGRAIDPGGEVTLKAATGEFAFQLNNRDRVFSPENSASTLTGKILPGRAVTFRKLSPSGQLYTLISGVLDSFKVAADTARTFTGNVLDGWATPGAVKLSTPLYQSIRTGTAIGIVLDQAGWTGPRDIDPGATIIPWWWEENTDAASAIDKIVASEGAPAIAYVEGGTFVFKDRHHRLFDTRANPGASTLAAFDFEYGITGFTATSGCNATATTAQAQNGIGSLLMTVVGTPSQAYVRPNANWGTNPGGEYRATMWVRSSVSTTVTAALDWSNSLGYVGGQYPTFAVTANTWTQITVSGAVPAGATMASYGPTLITPANGQLLYLDNVIFEMTNATQGIFTHIEPAGTGPSGDFKIEKGSWDYDHGTRNIFNIATFAVDIRTASLTGEIWVSEDPVNISSGSTMVLTIQGEDPFFNALTPVVGTDIIVASGTVSSVSLSRTSGQTAVLSITCSASTVITRMAIRATPVPVTRTIQVSARDQSSIGLYKQQNWPDTDNPVWAGQYDAQVIADRIVALYATYRPVVTFTVYAINATYLAKLLDLKISDRITVRHDPTGVNGAFMIEKLRHKVSDKMQSHRVEVTCVAAEPQQPTNVFTFGVAGKGFNDGRFGVNGIDSTGSVFRFDMAGQGFDQGTFAN